MKLVHTSQDTFYLHHIKNILEAKDITCLIKNDRLSSIAGEIPVGEAWPELWVVDNINEVWAKELIKESETTQIQGEKWTCENCGEEHAPQFKDCWNCQSIKGF